MLVFGAVCFLFGGEPHFILKNQGTIYDTKPNNTLLQGKAIHLSTLLDPPQNVDYCTIPAFPTYLQVGVMSQNHCLKRTEDQRL